MFNTFPPSKILQPFITTFYSIKFEKGINGNEINEYCLPNGHGIIAFLMKGKCFITIDKNKFELPRSYVVGQQTSQYQMSSIDEKLEIFGILFRPTGLWHIFDKNMSSLVNTAFPLQSLFQELFDETIQKLHKTSSSTERILILEEILLKCINKISYRPNMIDVAIDMMNATYGCSKIIDIRKKLNVSERHFQKKFVQMVGISPSSLNRIIRFNYFFSEISHKNFKKTKTIQGRFSYYDQAHFSKDFKKYCGAPPSKFDLDKLHFLNELMSKSKILMS